MTAAPELIRRLKQRYAPPEWVLLDEVYNATGGRASNRFDAVGLRCYPSGVGMIRIGFEVKVSRGDFARELERHDKRHALEKLCHEVCFVVARDVCEAREVPEPWGLLVEHGDTLKTVRKAAHRKVGPIGDDFAVSMIRHAHAESEERFSRKLNLAGKEVTEEVVQAYVESQVQRERERLQHLLEGARKANAEAQTARGQTERWAEILNALRQSAGLQLWPPADPSKPPTHEELAGLMSAIRGRVIADMRASLTRAGASIQNALFLIDGLPKDPPAPSAARPDDAVLDKLAAALLEMHQGPKGSKLLWTSLVERAKEQWRERALKFFELCRT